MGIYAKGTDKEAIVYFLRRRTRAAKQFKLKSQFNFWHFVDKKCVGLTWPGYYTFATIQAGEHVVWTLHRRTPFKNYKPWGFEVSVEAGKTYYLFFWFGEDVNPIAGSVELVSLDEEGKYKIFPPSAMGGKESIKKTRYIELTTTGKKLGAKFVESYYDKAKRRAGWNFFRSLKGFPSTK